MTTIPLDPRYIELIAKQLPPSGVVLRLIDLDGKTGAQLVERRADIEVVSEVLSPDDAENSVDAVLFITSPDDGLLAQALYVLRAGGRLIGIDPDGTVIQQVVNMLETTGFIRILVEPAEPAGVLLRGEKPHVTDDTLVRIGTVAQQDAKHPDLSAFKGKYVHLLVRQTPNKPVWALQPEETLQWHAVGVMDGDQIAALAFSSLPNAVAFMQRAVLAGAIQGVNKVAKFTREVAESWSLALVINPTFAEMEGAVYVEIVVDPVTAVTGEE